MGDGATGIEPGWAVRRLVDWAKDQDLWVRRLVAGVLDHQGVLPSEALDSVYSALLIEKELAEGELLTEMSMELAAGERVEGQPLRLDRLTGVEGVNALATGQEISFNQRLTILFGENAAGKSGYVRLQAALEAYERSCAAGSGPPPGVEAHTLPRSFRHARRRQVDS